MLTANQQNINLGKLRNGEPKRFKFVLTNTGDKVIKIKSLQAGCGSCTQASIDKTIIGVGDTADLSVIFTPKSTGIQTKSVSVLFQIGDAAASSIRLTFNANVW